MGKAYANKRSVENRPIGDLYHTPKSLVWELLKKEKLIEPVWECACGEGAITDVLSDNSISYKASDISSGINFLEIPNDFKWNGTIFTNPPFTYWDEFVMKAKQLTTKNVIMLGRLNYFGTQSRYDSNIWEGLKKVYIFTRYVDYQTPKRNDGLFHVGSLCTGWFLFDMDYTGEPTVGYIDVKGYAKLGNYDNKKCRECKESVLKYINYNNFMECPNCGILYDPLNKEYIDRES
jgi:hypothetical protein